MSAGSHATRLAALENRPGAAPVFEVRLCDHTPEPGTACAICPPLAVGGLRITLDLGTTLGEYGEGVR
jgi:hypothetical protein